MTNVALCLFGLVGGEQGKNGRGKKSNRILQIGYQHYKKHLIADNIDVYIHTWSVELQKEIKHLYKPKDSIFEDQIIFNVPSYVIGNKQRNQSHYSRWYSTYKVTELLQEQYDFVILSRFDVALHKDIVFKELDSNYFYVCGLNQIIHNGEDVFKGGRGKLYRCPQLLKHSEEKMVGYPYTDGGLLDMWFIANSSNIKKFGELYTVLNDYNRGQCPLNKDGTISSHELSLYHCQQTGLEPKIRILNKMYDDFSLIRRKFFKCKR